MCQTERPVRGPGSGEEDSTWDQSPQPNFPLPSRCMLLILLVGTMAVCWLPFIERLLCTYIVLSTSRCAIPVHLCNKCIKKTCLPAFLRQSNLSLSEIDLPTFTDDQGYGWQKPTYGRMCQQRGSVGSNRPLIILKTK